MNSVQIRKLTYSAMLLALAVLMPRVAGLIPQIGKTLNLMHIPVLLCGFLCGWPWGLAVGFVSPLLSSLVNTMPKIYPDAVVMAFELAAYGCVAGLVYRMLPPRKWRIYAALGIAMVAGRIVYGIVYFCLLKAGLVSVDGALLAFVWTKTVVTPVWGIVLQVALVPVLVMILEKARLIPDDRRKNG